MAEQAVTFKLFRKNSKTQENNSAWNHQVV